MTLKSDQIPKNEEVSTDLILKDLKEERSDKVRKSLSHDFI